MTTRLSEYAALELLSGRYRLIQVSWDRNGRGGSYDYFHAAFEPDGRWNAEFYDSDGQSIWVYGTEASLDFQWEHRTGEIAKANGRVTGDPGIRVDVRDVAFDEVPSGALCQTADERGDGIPRHWKKWRIV